MKYIFDLDDTLIQSTTLNNDAYNYALEKFDYPRIDTKERLTREKLKFIPEFKLEKIIEEKQRYFTSEWLPYRVIFNSELIKKIKEYGQENCYLWTKASKERVEPILKYCNLRVLFSKVIYDNKVTLNTSIEGNSIERSNKQIYTVVFIQRQMYGIQGLSRPRTFRARANERYAGLS